MKRVTLIGYYVVSGLMILLCLYAFFAFGVDIKRLNSFPRSIKQTTVGMTKIENAEAFGGKSELYFFSLGNITQDYNTLYVYTVNQNVSIRIGDEIIYTCSADKKGLYTGTTGKMWHKLKLAPEDAAKIISIECVACFQGAKGIKPVIYFGEEYDIKWQIVSKEMLALLLCLGVTVTGIILFFTELIKKKMGAGNEALYYAGVFVTLSGLWKITQLSSTAVLFDWVPRFSVMTYFCLMLVVIPYLLSVKAMLQGTGKIWYVPMLFNLVFTVLSLLLLVFGYFELKQTVVIICVSLALTFLVVFVQIFKNMRENGKTELLRLIMIENISCCFWFVFDALYFYLTKGSETSTLGILGIVVYLVMMIRSSVIRSSRMMEVGVHAKNFAKLAFRDMMTGFFNRAAYADYLDNNRYPLKDTVVLLFDLNNLKKCNDTLGHVKGDEYIKSSAGIIEECFSGLGDCFRLGGDEFVVICPNANRTTVVERCDVLESKVSKYNQASKDIKMGIAYGYAWYEEGRDTHFEDIIKRADAMMYGTKKRMKQENT